MSAKVSPGFLGKSTTLSFGGYFPGSGPNEKSYASVILGGNSGEVDAPEEGHIALEEEGTQAGQEDQMISSAEQFAGAPNATLKR